MAELTLSVEVAAPPERTWAALVDWDRQGEWMLGTTVTGDGADRVGGTLRAKTGFGPVGFLDTMTITAWLPPYRCEVVHTGRVVRGSGTFEVEATPDGSRFVWTELLELPLGAVGRFGWPLVRPAFAAGVKLSLQRFARYAEAY